MAKRRTISYRNTAILAVTGGIVSAAAACADLVAQAASTDLGSLNTVLGAVGIVAWFLGCAAGILTLSTEYKRAGIVALVLGGIAILLFMLSPTLTA